MTHDGLNDHEQTEKDTSDSPASEAETQAKQQDPVPDTLDPEAAERVKVAPGTGGPDDAGEVDVDMDVDDVLPPADERDATR